MFDDLHDPAPSPVGLDTLAKVSTRAQQLRRRRSLLVGGGGVVVLALAVAAVVLPGRDDQRLVSVDEPTTEASTVGPSPSTDPATEPSPATDPPVTEPAGTDASAGDACRDAASPPVWLVDGSSPGEVTFETGDDGTMVARWGADGATTSVVQVAPQPETAAFELVAGSDQLVSSGPFRAAVVPVADAPIGPITIALDDGDCERWYRIGPDVELEQAIAYAQDWVDALRIDATSEVTTTADEVCVTVPWADFEHCTEIDPRTASGSFYWDPVPGTALWSFMAIVPDGSSIDSPSSLASVRPVPGLSDVLLIDVMRSGACSDIRQADGTLMNLVVECELRPDGPLTAPGVVAIDANGDAVVIDGAGKSTVIHDGTDPDDPLPLEGEVTFVDGVAVAGDGSSAFVGVCCEPVPGSLVAVDLATGEGGFVGFGHLPAFTSFGDLVWASLGTADSDELVPVVRVGADPGTVTTDLYEFPLDSRIIDLAVVPEPSGLDDAILVLLATPDGVELWRLMAAGGDMTLSTRVSDVAWTEDAGLSLAGYSADAFFVLDDVNDRLLEFDGFTLQPRVVPDFSEFSVSVWMTPTTARGVSPDRRLIVDGIEVPGEYLWVR